MTDDRSRNDRHRPNGQSTQRRTSSIGVRVERPEDGTAVDQIVREAFAGEKVAALLDSMRGDHSWLDLSFVAELKEQPGTLAGHVAFTRGWIDGPDRLEQVLILSPLSVHPSLQRRGFGAALVDQSLRMLRGREESLVFLEGDPRYYQRLGFEAAEPLGFLRPSPRIPGPAFQVRHLRSPAASCTGALVYPDVFWRHDAVGLR